MSTYKLEKLADYPVVLFSAAPDHNITAAHEEADAESRALLVEQTEPVYYVVDLSQITYDFQDILTGSKSVVKQDPIYSHSNIIETIFVMEINQTVAKVFEGFAGAAFGHFKPKLYNSLDEALEYVQTRVNSDTA